MQIAAEARESRDSSTDRSSSNVTRLRGPPIDDEEHALNKSKYAVALVGLGASSLVCAGGPVAVGISMGAVVGTAIGTAIAQATGLPLEAIGGGAVFAIAAIALVAGIRIVVRKQGR